MSTTGVVYVKEKIAAARKGNKLALKYLRNLIEQISKQSDVPDDVIVGMAEYCTDHYIEEMKEWETQQ